MTVVSNIFAIALLIYCLSKTVAVDNKELILETNKLSKVEFSVCLIDFRHSEISKSDFAEALGIKLLHLATKSLIEVLKFESAIDIPYFIVTS